MSAYASEDVMNHEEDREATQHEMRQRKERDAVRLEAGAMADAFDALQPLGEEARFRAVRWLAQALDLPRIRANREEVPF